MSDSLDAWCLVVPVKLLAHAKSRLAAPAGAHREALALAFAADTVAAALRSPAVAAVFVVTDDPAARAVLCELGAVVVADQPAAGLNAALEHGGRVAVERHPDCGIGALSADLPALLSAELSLALALASPYPSAVVADAGGSGTTLYVAKAGTLFAPAYGAGSLRRHVASGAQVLDEAGLRSLRRDVDTRADLTDALRIGVGPHTAAVVARLGVQ
jgi:2-phospho-L-lactate guanylyltransferase